MGCPLHPSLLNVGLVALALCLPSAPALALSEAEREAALRAAPLQAYRDCAREVGKPLTIDAAGLDLNRDGIDEVLLTLSHAGGTGCFGMVGQAKILMIRNAAGQWTPHLGFEADEVRPLPHRVGGYPDLAIQGRGACASVWRWSGATYRLHRRCDDGQPVPISDGAAPAPTAGTQPLLPTSVVYTATRGPTCRLTRADPEYTAWQCPGPAGREVILTDLGNLFGLQFGTNSEHEPPYQAAGEAVGPKIEWRMRGGEPYAAIYRAYVAEEQVAPGAITLVTRQVLVVVKVDGAMACHLAYVDARLPEANAKAASLADAKAAAFRCGIDRPERLGSPAAFAGAP